MRGVSRGGGEGLRRRRAVLRDLGEPLLDIGDMSHVLQAARVNADSLENAWAALHADIARLGSANNAIRPILSFDPKTKRVAASDEETPIGEEPRAWRRLEDWVRNCWLLAFHQVEVGPLHQPWNHVARAKRFEAKLKATATDKLPALFFAEILREFRSLYEGLSPEQSDDLLASHRREALVSAFERARRTAPEALPFIAGVPPGDWPALDVHALGQKGQRRHFFLLADLHL